MYKSLQKAKQAAANMPSNPMNKLLKFEKTFLEISSLTFLYA
jgi:hypothetical protein